MKNPVLLKNGTLVNEGKIQVADIYLKGGRIEKIADSISAQGNEEVFDCAGLHVLPGIVDDQVHFREPGLTHKGNLFTESRAAVAGGITTFMEMPNTNPTTTNAFELDNKLNLAKGRSWANYAFFFGASNTNLEDVLKVDQSKTCGIKIFMGSSTGNMLVNDNKVLEQIFAGTPLTITTHCEDEPTIIANLEIAKIKFGDNIPITEHPVIRSREACFLSSSFAISLAKKHGTNLHILHLTTAEELQQFEPGPMKGKKITAEVCVHHLWYNDADYERLGGLIKCNPAIKNKSDQDALWTALQEDRIDIIATDHAPHTWEEKQGNYLKCPSGLPLVQHSMAMMLTAVNQKKISLEKMVDKMCHRPADRFQVAERGYLREGYWADIAVVNLSENQTVRQEEVLYHCGWTPLKGENLLGKNVFTFVNGHLVFDRGNFLGEPIGAQVSFNRK
jgi:dihydroorotase